MRGMRPAARIAFTTGLLALALAAVLMAAGPSWLVPALRERAFDALSVWFPRAVGADEAVVVDIDRDSLMRHGPWPWPRDRMAGLTSQIASARPKLIAFDLLFAARGRDAEDESLAKAFGALPVVLGAVLDPERGSEAGPVLALAVTGGPDVSAMQQAPGLVLPAPALLDAAGGIGIVSLAQPEGQPVRAVPLLVAASGKPQPGFALEAVRQALGDATLIIDGKLNQLRIKTLDIPLRPAADMRLHQAGSVAVTQRTISAARVLGAEFDPAALSGKIVVVGASAPEAGGLRRSAADPFMPSVQIQADAIGQMLNRQHLIRPAWALRGEIAAAAAMGLAGIALAAFAPPAVALSAIAALAALWAATAVGLFSWAQTLIDPLSPPLAALLAFQAAASAGYAVNRRLRLALERRFSQYIAPEVVRRIADDPSIVKLSGEERVITALFTDIEGFTALSERAAPADVVTLLDAYFDAASEIVIAHGGMIDKFVGDAIHAFFNAPLDLADHALKAVRCAEALIARTEALRQEPLASRLGLGRTRIGIETGRAVLGDVGGKRRLDYTAYGMAVNLAARLEQANKIFGTSIAIGPGCAETLQGRIALKPAGVLKASKDSPESQAWTVG